MRPTFNAFSAQKSPKKAIFKHVLAVLALFYVHEQL